MRTAIVRSVVIAGTFVTGLVCGLQLCLPGGVTARVHLPSAAEIRIRIGSRGRHRRPGAPRPSASPAEEAGRDEGWDTYRPGAESDDE
jgi:hypothetical protein